jgi:hypothetical protein
MWTCNAVDNVPTSNAVAIYFNQPYQPRIFFKGVDYHVLLPDEDIVVTEGNYFYVGQSYKANTIEKSIEIYPSIGSYTDYQLDTTIRPSTNASYDGEYTEPLTEVEVDGVKFVPTTLSVDGVEYKVLAEAQPTPDPEEPVEPTNEG